MSTEQVRKHRPYTTTEQDGTARKIKRLVGRQARNLRRTYLALIVDDIKDEKVSARWLAHHLVFPNKLLYSHNTWCVMVCDGV